MTITKLDNPTTFDKRYLLEFTGEELVVYPPNNMIKVCYDTWQRSQKISDWLMYMSEIAKAIEELPKSGSGEGEQ